jgi:hypothetical protein
MCRGIFVAVPLQELPDWLPTWCLDHLGREPSDVQFQRQQVSMVFGLQFADGSGWRPHCSTIRTSWSSTSPPTHSTRPESSWSGRLLRRADTGAGILVSSHHLDEVAWVARSAMPCRWCRDNNVARVTTGARASNW